MDIPGEKPGLPKYDICIGSEELEATKGKQHGLSESDGKEAILVCCAFSVRVIYGCRYVQIKEQKLTLRKLNLLLLADSLLSERYWIAFGY